MSPSSRCSESPSHTFPRTTSFAAVRCGVVHINYFEKVLDLLSDQAWFEILIIARICGLTVVSIAFPIGRNSETIIVLIALKSLDGIQATGL